NVQNTPPVVTLAVEPASPRLGEVVTLRVDRVDTGFDDEHTYQWTLDGQPVSSLSPRAFVATFSHEVPGPHSVSVTVTDDEGASATASASYTVASAPPSPPTSTPPP